MSQIQNLLPLAIASTLLGTSTAAAQYSIPSNNSVMPHITTMSRAVKPLKRNRGAVSEDSYSLTMTLPKQPRSGFAKLSFSFTKPDREQTIVPIHLNLKNTTAFVGTSRLGDAIEVKDAWIDETGVVWVELNSPVAAKTTLTVVFKVRQPLSAGQYIYSIAAYPNTKPTIPVFVDSGTLRI